LIFQVATWSKHHEKINFLCLLGDHILSSDIKGNVYMWSFKGDALNLEPVSHIKLENNFTPTCIVHPDTYLNKVLKNVLTC
jgi:U3 small nucleolar RNA-associated protein 21